MNSETTEKPEDTPHPRLPTVLTVELTRLYNANFSLIPLGGEDGKKPAVAFRDRARLPLGTVIERMGRSGTRTYGIRLGGLLVVDVDTDTPDARAFVETHFGTSPARTRTSRGFHLWFRHSGRKPKQIRLPGISIDFKSGPNEYVVGPNSERPDGVIYWPEGRLAAISDLPIFRDRCDAAGPANTSIPEIAVGARNDSLTAYAVKLARSATSRDALLKDLFVVRDKQMADVASFPDTQVISKADWAWKLVTEGKIWGGGNPVVVLRSETVARLIKMKAHRALSLLAFLKIKHGANPDTQFAIDPRALRAAGHFRDGVSQIYAAIKVLIQCRELKRTKLAKGKRNHHLYVLLYDKEGGKGERVSSYISTQNGCPKAEDEQAA